MLKTSGLCKPQFAFIHILQHFCLLAERPYQSLSFGFFLPKRPEKKAEILAESFS